LFIFFLLLLITAKGWGQTTLFQFNFEDVLTPVIDNASGTPSFTSSGVGTLNFNATTPCENLKMYQGSYWTIADYYQFTVNTTGFSSLIFSYCERGSNVLMGSFLVRASADGTNWTTILPEYVPSLTNVTSTTAVLPASCENAPTVLIQIYKTTSPTSTGQSLRIDNAILAGTPETSPPVATFIPANGAIDVLVNIIPTITFNEPVQKIDGTPLTNADLATLVTLKTTDAAGADVPFTAIINDAKTIITVTPTALLGFSKLYYLAVGAVKDNIGNMSGTQFSAFTTLGDIISSDATLSELKVDGTTVAGFSPSTYTYSFELPYGTTLVPTVTATPVFGLATLAVTPAVALPGSTHVLVTAQDGITQLSYTVSFTLVAPSSDANLSNLRWLPAGASQSILVTGFVASVTTYSTVLPAEVSSLSLVASLAQSAATAVITPPSDLLGTLAQRTGSVVVTAQDGITIKTYSVIFSVTSGMPYHFKEGFVGFPPANWNYSGNITTSTSNGVGIFAAGLSCPKFKWTTPLDGGILVTPTCNTAGTLEFYIRVLDTDPAHELHMYVEKSTDGGTNWTTLNTDPMPMNGSTVIWHQVIVPVNDNSSAIILRLRGTANTGTTSLGLFYVDDMSLTMNSAADASLSDIQVNGTTVPGFLPSLYDYNVILPAGSSNVPTVTATPTQLSSLVSYTNTTVLPGTTSVLVTAPNGVSTNTYTLNFSVALSAPSNLTAVLASAGQVNLNWYDINTDESGFRIERKPGNGLFAEVATVGANVTTFTDAVPGLDPALFIPADRFASVTVTSGVKFADVTNYKGIPTSLFLDVYEPAGDNTPARPVIIWIHGGGFRTDSYRTQGYIVDYSTRFAKRGYVCMSIDYRLRAAADMPTQASEFPALQDAARDANEAISWIKAHAADYNIDPNLIFIAGGSAGGRTSQTVCQFDGPDPSALYAPENQYLATPWNKTGIVANATLWGGPEPEMRGWLYPSPPYSTANYLQATDVPSILVHGDADVTILPQNSIDLNNALVAAGVASELHIIPGATHSCLGKETEISAWLASFFAQKWSSKIASVTSYTYRVRAYYAAGNSAYSNEASLSFSKTLNLKAYLSGFWNGSAMNQTQDADIDYNTWNKWAGTVVDTLSIYLAEENSPWGFVLQAHALNINIDGSLSIAVPPALSGNYYIAMVHRNSIETWTANPVSFAGNTIAYDFTTSASQAFGSNQSDLNGDGSVWGLFAGEMYGAGGTLPADGYIDINDLNAVYNKNVNAVYGYTLEDITGDGFVDISDLNMTYNNNVNGIGLNTPVSPMKRPGFIRK
jgi:acetyl esterase/lipase